jgi:hypothetical protein
MWPQHCEPYVAWIQPNALIAVVGPFIPNARSKQIPHELFTGNEVGIDLSSTAEITRKSVYTGPKVFVADLTTFVDPKKK